MKEHTISGNTFAVKTVNIDYIKDSGNIRANDSDVSDLAASIKAHGMLHPITVTQDKASLGLYYVLVAGHRRFAAAKQIGLKEIPCHVIGDQSKAALQEIALTENVSRVEMTPYEECLAVKNLENKKNTPAQIAKRLGRTVRWVMVRKKLADAGKEVLEKVKDGKIELGAAAKLVELPDKTFKQEMEDAWNLTANDAERIIHRLTHDLDSAKFDVSPCLGCAKCSDAQKDLFENDQKAFCLDNDCWNKMCQKQAQKRVQELQAEGKQATCDGDEFDDNGIEKWASDFKVAEENGIAKRVFVHPHDLTEVEYYDRRDLPDFEEETEEQREERIEKENTEREFERKRESMFKERLRKAIIEKCFDFSSHADSIVTVLAFVSDNYLISDEAAKECLGVETEDGYCGDLEDIPEGKTFRDVANAIRRSGETVLDVIYSTSKLQKLYTMVSAISPEKLMPTDKEVQAAIDEEKSNENSEEDEEDQQ